MLRWAILLLVIGLFASVQSLAGGLAGVAQQLFVVATAILAISLVLGLRAGQRTGAAID